MTPEVQTQLGFNGREVTTVQAKVKTHMHEVNHVIKQALHHNTPYEHCLSKNKKRACQVPLELDYLSVFFY